MTLDELEKRLRAARVYRLVVLPGEPELKVVASTFREDEPVSVTARGLEIATSMLLARLDEPANTLQCRACVAASFGEELTTEAITRARAIGALCPEHEGETREVEE